MGRGAGAAAGGVAGVEVSVGVVGEVCATLVAVAPNNEAIKAAARTKLSREVLFMIRACFSSRAGFLVDMDLCPRSDCKLLAADEGVQLIVFFAVIREILKREIYRGDKKRFCAKKTKGQFGTNDGVRSKSQIRPIRFVNAEDGARCTQIQQPVRFPRDGGKGSSSDSGLKTSAHWLRLPMALR
jgi:hypothetical protein